MSFDAVESGTAVDAIGFGAEHGARAAEDWREIHRQLRRLAARRAALDAEEVRWLLAARRAEVHRHLGFASWMEYIERTLGYAPRTALDRLRVAEALETLPATRDALASGHLSYSAVREITRVATRETEAAWIDAAAGKTVREVEAGVAGHKPGDTPDDPGDPEIRLRRITLELPEDVYALFLSARRHLESETGERLTDGDVMACLCDAVLAHKGGDGRRAPRYQIALTTCASCGRGWQDAAGQVLEVSPGTIARAQCDAQRIGRVDGDHPEPVTDDIPAAVRRQVERRDHGRCAVPGCRRSSDLHMHHVIPRAEGGDHDPSRLLLLCTAHHRLVHDDRLRIGGAAPHFAFAGVDGRPYGAVALDEVETTPPPNMMAEARAALRTLGYSAAEATAAVDRARAHVDAGASLEELIRAALQASACRRPRGRARGLARRLVGAGSGRR